MSIRSVARYTDSEIISALREAGIPTHGCVAIACARALSAAEDTREVAEWLPLVVETLRKQHVDSGWTGLDANGSYRGGIAAALDLLGIEYRHQRESGETYDIEGAWVEGHYRRGNHGGSWVEGYYREPTYRTKYPTVKQWLKDNPHVKRAVISTHAHAAFIDHGTVHAATMRYRVRAAFIVEEDEAARLAEYEINRQWHDVSIREIEKAFASMKTPWFVDENEDAKTLLGSIVVDRMKDQMPGAKFTAKIETEELALRMTVKLDGDERDTLGLDDDLRLIFRM